MDKNELQHTLRRLGVNDFSSSTIFIKSFTVYSWVVWSSASSFHQWAWVGLLTCPKAYN